MLLYDLEESGNCYKVRLLAAHLGLPLELEPLDEDDRESALASLNPLLEVPTLILDDGRPLAQSGAILLYLAEGSPFLPDDRYRRAQVTQWLLFEQTAHRPVSRARYWLRWGEPEGFGDRLPECQAAGYEALGVMDAHLTVHEFLVGDGFSVADIALFAYTHIAEQGRFDLDRVPAVGAWLDRVAAQPGHVPMMG
jgi:glutathione S-transferase